MPNVSQPWPGRPDWVDEQGQDMTRLGKVLGNPKHYLQRALKLLLWKFSAILGDAPFFLQGQMDINPKSLWHDRDFVAKVGGYFIKGDRTPRVVSSFDPWDATRRDMLVLLLRTILERNIPGDMVEVGVYRGRTARLIHHYVPERDLFLFDTFEGFTNRGTREELSATGHLVAEGHFADTSLEYVKTIVAPQNGRVHFIRGYFPESIPERLENRTFAFVHLDADLYEPTLAGLGFFYPRMAHHGIIIVHDYNAWPGARCAVDEFMQDKPELVVSMPDKSGSALISRFRAYHPLS
jgi:O-methyltransferase